MAFFTALNGERHIVDDEGTVFPAWSWAYQTPVFRLTVNAARYDYEDEWFYVVEVSGPDIDGGPGSGLRSAWLGPFIERFCDAAVIQSEVADLLNHGLTHATAEGWNPVTEGSLAQH